MNITVIKTKHEKEYNKFKHETLFSSYNNI